MAHYQHYKPKRPKHNNIKINAMQRLFIDEYIRNGLNGTAAARTVGYKNPANSARQILKQPYVIQYLRKMRAMAEDSIIAKTLPTFEDKASKLWDVAQDGKPTETISAIGELNKMQGHHAAEKHINIDINADVDISRIVDKIAKLREEVKSEY